MDNDSSEDDIPDDDSSGFDATDLADDTKKRIAYFSTCNPTPNQLERYELFHRFSFTPKKGESREDKFTKVVNQMIGGKMNNEQVKLLLATTAKLYVARLVESGIEIAGEEDYHGPLLPEHIQEAKRRMTKTRETILN